MNLIQILVLGIAMLSFQVEDVKKLSHEELAQGQLEAYNNQDINSFLSFYAEDVEIYNFPNEFVYSGKDKMRERYQKAWAKNPNQKASVSKRMLVGNTVVDREHVIGRVNQREVNIIAIYKIEKHKIKQVYFIRE